MTPLQPRAVPPRSAWDWALAAFSLVTARWYWHVPLALATAAGAAVLPAMLRVSLVVVAIGLCAVLARATSEHRPVLALLRAHAVALLRIGLMLTAALLATVVVLQAAWPPDAPVPASGPGGSVSALDFAAGREALGIVALAAACPGSLFFLALLVFLRAPLLRALDLSVEAVRLNRFTLFVGPALVGLIALGAAWTGLTVVALLPFTGALVWVAFRHVFLGVAPPAGARSRPAHAAGAVARRAG